MSNEVNQKTPPITEGDKFGTIVFPIRMVKHPTTGNKCIEIVCRFDDAGHPRRLVYSGWLTPKAIDETRKLLNKILESKSGPTKIDLKTGAFSDPSFINYNKEYRFSVVFEEYKDKQGMIKTIPKIRWINNMSLYEPISSQEEASEVLDNLGLSDESEVSQDVKLLDLPF